jgi:hypothetical protein
LNQINTRENPIITSIGFSRIYFLTLNTSDSSNQIKKYLAQDYIRRTLRNLSQQAVSGHTPDAIGKAVAAGQLMATASTGEFVPGPAANQTRAAVPVQCPRPAQQAIATE